MTAYTQTLATDSCCICNGVAPSIWKQVGKNLTKQEVSVRTLQKSNKKILNSQEITSRTIRRSQTKTFNRSEISTATMAKRSGKQIITDSCMICNGFALDLQKTKQNI
jgi:precorrin isomerase